MLAETFAFVKMTILRHVMRFDSLYCRGGSSGYVPLVSPTFFRLCISSSQLSACTGETYLNGHAFGPFTTDLMSLTWTHRDCIIYCSGEVTETNALKMTKRR